jgi:hypothetical protein
MRCLCRCLWMQMLMLGMRVLVGKNPSSAHVDQMEDALELGDAGVLLSKVAKVARTPPLPFYI